MAAKGFEVWRIAGGGPPSEFVRQAQLREAGGYDGIAKPDSQNLTVDCYVALAAAAAVTKRIKLAPGVTNPVTRHPAVTAGAIASVHALSGGRAELGLGRGDSALAHLGYAPVSPAALEAYVRKVQAFLRGEEVPFEDNATLESLALAEAPKSSRLEWLKTVTYPKVPVDVAATGPKVIAAAARVADGVTFAVGADPARLRWAIGVAREARERSGLDPDGLRLSAYVNLVVDDDPTVARKLGEGSFAVMARFSAMHGTMVGPASELEKQVTESVRQAYHMGQHGQVGSPQAALLTDEFAREYGIFGAPAYCTERLLEIAATGIQRVVMFGPTLGVNVEQGDAAEARFEREVLPVVRRETGRPMSRARTGRDVT